MNPSDGPATGVRHAACDILTSPMNRLSYLFVVTTASVIWATCGQHVDVARGSVQSCPIGESRPVELMGDDKLATPTAVVDCGRLRHFGEYLVVAYRLGLSSKSSYLCVDVQFLASGNGVGGCDEPTGSERLSLGWGGESGRWQQIWGRATPAVASVDIRYRSYGRVRRRHTNLTRVTDSTILARISSKPFSFFIGEYSPRAREAKLLARSASGKTLEAIQFL